MADSGHRGGKVLKGRNPKRIFGEQKKIFGGIPVKKLLLLLSLTYWGTASGQSNQEIFNESAVVCVSTLLMASLLAEPRLSKMVFERDAQWWRSVLAVSVADAEADRRIETEMQKINARWGNEEISWDQLLDIAEKCGEMKFALESPTE